MKWKFQLSIGQFQSPHRQIRSLPETISYFRKNLELQLGRGPQRYGSGDSLGSLGPLKDCPPSRNTDPPHLPTRCIQQIKLQSQPDASYPQHLIQHSDHEKMHNLGKKISQIYCPLKLTITLSASCRKDLVSLKNCPGTPKVRAKHFDFQILNFWRKHNLQQSLLFDKILSFRINPITANMGSVWTLGSKKGP